MKNTHLMTLVNKDYLSAYDLLNEEGEFIDTLVTVSKVELKKIVASKGDIEKEKALIFFKNISKAMILTNTTAKILMKQLKIEFSNQLIGATFTLTASKEKHFGEWMHVLRPSVKVVKEIPTITDERFNTALEKIAAGEYTKEKLKASFTLTPSQNEKLR